MAQKLKDTQPMDAAGLWKRYGNTLLTVVVLVLLAVVGWRQWQQYQYKQEVAAGQNFEALVMLASSSTSPIDEQKTQQINDLVKRITEDHANLLYADLARLIQARVAVDAGQLDIAMATLRTEMAQGHDDFSKGRARIELARLHNDRQQYSEALGLLGEGIPEGLMPQMLEVRGDALKGQGHTAEAREAWQKALDQAKEQNTVLYGLKLKLDDLTAEENR